MTTLLISAGDASGDLHAATFVRSFRAAHPDARFVGMGGDAMARAGVELVVHQRELAIGGLLELTGSLVRIAKVWRQMDRAVSRILPDLVVLVDSGGFNIPFAKRVRKRCNAKVFYFVAPQVWAWRPRRISKLVQRVDRMAVIFPFEPKEYAQTSLPVEFVGHPLAEGLEKLARETDRDAARASLGLDPLSRVVSVFPGSRRNEVASHLPCQLAACARLHRRFPGIRFLVASAPSVSREAIDAQVAAQSLPAGMKLDVVSGRAYDAMLACDVAIAKPGTVTVELAMLARPMVVVGKVDRLTAAVLRRSVRVPYLAMPNLVAGREVLPELLQEAATPERISEAVADLIEGDAREQQLKDLAQVRQSLMATGSARRASEIAGEMLEGSAN